MATESRRLLREDMRETCPWHLTHLKCFRCNLLAKLRWGPQVQSCDTRLIRCVFSCSYRHLTDFLIVTSVKGVSQHVVGQRRQEASENYIAISSGWRFVPCSPHAPLSQTRHSSCSYWQWYSGLHGGCHWVSDRFVDKSFIPRCDAVAVMQCAQGIQTTKSHEK